MTNTINNVPRELLERVLYLMDNYIGTIHTEEDELRALLSAPSPAGVDGLEVFAVDIQGREVVDCVRHDQHQAIIDGLRGEVARLQRAEKNDSIAYKAALERQDELREEISDMHRKLDKFYRKSHGVPALAEIERLSEERDQQAQRIGELASHLEFAVTLLTVAGLAGNAQVEAMRAALSAGNEPKQCT